MNKLKPSRAVIVGFSETIDDNVSTIMKFRVQQTPVDARARRVESFRGYGLFERPAAPLAYAPWNRR